MASNFQQAALSTAAARVGGRLFGLKFGIILVAAVLLLAIIIGPIVAIGGIPHTNGASAADPACAGGAADPTAAASHAAVAGYAGDQLKNAALIINAGASLGAPSYGINIAVMTAMGESALRVLDHGDVAGPDSRGLFQQRDNWGPLSVRMDPTGSALLFFKALLGKSGWQSMDPSQAAHAVQGNADPSYYTKYWSAAQQVVAALTYGSGGGCTTLALGNASQSAQTIMQLTKTGKIKWLDPRYEAQVQAYASSGGSSPSCYLDPRLLQVIAIVAQQEAPIGVSDLNRKCTGDTPGAGVYSFHWKGMAVDFYMLRGQITNGRDGNADATIQLLDQISNTKGAVGQSQCGTLNGYQLTTLYTFADTCNHLHYQLGPGTDQLHLPSSSASATRTTREGTSL